MSNIKIVSNFESGSIGKVSNDGAYKLKIALKNDNNDENLDPHWRDWWYIKLANVPINKLVTITLENRVHSNYSLPVYSYDQKIWHRMREEEVTLLSKKENGNQTHPIVMEKQFARPTVWLARFYPYTYSRLIHFKRQYQNNPHLQVEELGCSPGSLPIELFTISEISKQHQPTHRVFIQTRSHPGETGSSFVLEGLINYLLSNDSRAKRARRHIIFNIIPMHNPDGVIAGNYRTNINSVNLDEAWQYNPDQLECLIDSVPLENKAVNSKTRLWLNNSSDRQSPPLNMAINLHASNDPPEKKAYFVPHFGPNIDDYNQQERALWHKIVALSEAVNNCYGGRIDHPLGEGGRSFLDEYYPETWWWKNQQDAVLAVTLETTYGKAGFNHWIREDDLRALGVALVRGILEYFEKRNNN